MFKLLRIDKIFSNVSMLSKYNLLYLDENKIHQVEVVSGAFMFMRKEVFDYVGWFDESFFLYGEDIDYCRRMYKKNKKIIYLPTATVIHYKGKSAYSHPIRVIYEFHQSMIKYY